MVRLYGSVNDEATRVDKFYCNVNNETREATKLYGATPQITSFSGSIVSGAGNIERLWAGGATFSAKLKSDFPAVWKRRDEIRYASVYCSGTNGGWFYINVFYADGTSVEVLNHGTVLFGLTEWGIIAYSTTSTNPGTDLINLTPIIRPCTKLIHQAVRHRDPMETEWGVVEYWTETRTGYGSGTATHNVGVNFDITSDASQTKIESFVNAYNVKFTNHSAPIWYGANDSWWFQTTSDDWTSVPTSVLQSQYNLYIYPNSQSDAEWELIDNAVLGVNKSGPTAVAKVRNETEFNTLCPASSGATATVDGNSIQLKAIKKFTFGTNPTTVPDKCLYYSDVEVVDLRFAAFTSVGNYFLAYCEYLNCPLTFPYGFVSTGNYFLAYDYAFDSEIFFPSAFTSVGNMFLYNCSAYNKPLHIDSLTTIGTYFMYGSGYNLPFRVPDGVTTLPNYFFGYKSHFTSTIDLNNVTTIGDYFMSNCSDFNNAIDFSKVTTIGKRLFASCRSFNQPLSFPALTSLGEYALYFASALNQHIYTPLLTAIPNSFMFGCHSYNTPIDLTGKTSIGGGFLNQASSFNSTITIPSTVTSVGAGFLEQVYLSCTVYCGAPATVAATSVYTFEPSSSNSEAYTVGVKLTGPYASDWHSRFPDSSSNYLRKTIVV